MCVGSCCVMLLLGIRIIASETSVAEKPRGTEDSWANLSGENGFIERKCCSLYCAVVCLRFIFKQYNQTQAARCAYGSVISCEIFENGVRKMENRIVHCATCFGSIYDTLLYTYSTDTCWIWMESGYRSCKL